MAVFALFQRLVAFSAHCVKVVEDKIYLNSLRQKYIAQHFFFNDILLMAIFAVDHPSEGVKMRNSPVVRSYSGRMTPNLIPLQQIGAWLKRRTDTVIPRGHVHSRRHCLVCLQPASC